MMTRCLVTVQTQVLTFPPLEPSLLLRTGECESWKEFIVGLMTTSAQPEDEVYK